VDQAYTEAWLAWGNVNVSIATTVDATDSSQLTVVATVVGGSNGGGDTKGGVSDGDDDLALLLIPRFSNGQ
jgi:hypothetical protein